MTTRIIFNQQEYASSDAMPPEVRRDYERVMALLPDANRNGVPDLLERGNVQRTSITVNGSTFGSVDEMPEGVRQLYEQVMRQADAKTRAGGGPLEVVATGSTGGLSPLSSAAGLGVTRTSGSSMGILRLLIVLAVLAGAAYLLVRR